MTTNLYEYPVTLTRDDTDGGYTVQFLDLPEAITQGDSIEDALEEARDALDEAVASRISNRQQIPAASEGNPRVALPASMALKAALFSALQGRNLSQVELALQLGVDEREVRRLLDPRHPSKLNRIEELLGKLGKRVIIGVEDVATAVEPARDSSSPNRRAA